MFKNIIAIILISLFLTNCGFKLKGSAQDSIESVGVDLDNIKINIHKNSYLKSHLNQLLGQTENPAAIYELNISNEKLIKKVLSYDQNSQPNNYQIGLSFDYQILDKTSPQQVIFADSLENFDFLFTEGSDSQSEINQQKLARLINDLGNQLAQLVYQQVLKQITQFKSQNETGLSQ